MSGSSDIYSANNMSLYEGLFPPESIELINK